MMSSAMRSLRIPLGFLWLLGVGVLLVAVIAYAFGYGRGKSAGFTEGLNQRLGQQTAADNTRAVQDPLVHIAQPATTTLQSSRTIRPATSAATTAPAITAATSKDPDGDPRHKNVNYFVIARPSEQSAAGMLAFCRAEGLDAYLVLDHNNSLSKKIVVLPGLASAKDLKSADGQKLEAQIKIVGQRWKAKSKGNKDFSDAYLETFR